MIPRPNTKHAIQLLQRPLLRLRQTKITKHKPGEIKRRVVCKRAGGCKGIDEGGPSEGNYEVEAPCGGGGKGHAVFADVEGEGFGGVGEGDGTFAGGVDDHEEIDAGGDAGEAACRVGFGDEEGEAGDEEHYALLFGGWG